MFVVSFGSQHANGPWSTTIRRKVGPENQTSIAVNCLSAPAHYLPIFRR